MNLLSFFIDDRLQTAQIQYISGINASCDSKLICRIVMKNDRFRTTSGNSYLHQNDKNQTLKRQYLSVL